MDLNYIATELLSQELIVSGAIVVQQEECVMAEGIASNETVCDPVVGEKQKVSFSDYLKRKKEMQAIIDGKQDDQRYRDRSDKSQSSDDESDDQESSGSSEEEDEDSSSTSEDEESEGIEDEVESVNDADIADDVSDLEISASVPRTKNEVSDLPPVQPPTIIKIPEENQMSPVGEIHAIIDDLVVVKSHQLTDATAVDNLALDNGSIIAFEDRTVLGEVFETFGPVDQPFYSIRFNRPEDIDHSRAVQGAPVYQSSALSKVVFTALLKAASKGTDASNIFDEELPEEEQDFSDDEAERQNGLKKKSKRKKNVGGGESTMATDVKVAAANVPRGEYVPTPQQKSGKKPRNNANRSPATPHQAQVQPQPFVPYGYPMGVPLQMQQQQQQQFYMPYPPQAPQHQPQMAYTPHPQQLPGAPQMYHPPGPYAYNPHANSPHLQQQPYLPPMTPQQLQQLQQFLMQQQQQQQQQQYYRQ